VVQCARALARLEGVVHFVIEDAAAPLSREDREALAAVGARVFFSRFHRGGNLTGAENLTGQLQFLELAGMVAGADGTPADWLLKVDSDTVVQRLDWLAGVDPEQVAAVCHEQPHWWFQGCCYALSMAWLPQLKALWEGLEQASETDPRRQELAKLGPLYPEDVTTGWLAVATAGARCVIAVPGFPAGLGIAHWMFKRSERDREAELCRPYAVVAFGNRMLLPSQMPEASQRLAAAQAMAFFLETAPFSRV